MIRMLMLSTSETAGDSGFTGSGHHNGIGHTHCHQKKLFNDQWYDQVDQCLPAEQRGGAIQGPDSVRSYHSLLKKDSKCNSFWNKVYYTP